MSMSWWQMRLACNCPFLEPPLTIPLPTGGEHGATVKFESCLMFGFLV